MNGTERGTPYGYSLWEFKVFGACGTTSSPVSTPPTTTPPPSTTPPTTQPPAGTAWAAQTAYTVGTVVTYGGVSYRCLQSHTSLPGWEPPNVPALWQRV